MHLKKPDLAVPSRHPVHENLLIGICLSFFGGFLDAYTYVLKGHVFANAQTGNFVLLSISLFSGNVKEAARYLIPICLFALGIFISEVIKAKVPSESAPRRIKGVLLFESVVLIFLAAAGNLFDDIIVNSLVSFLAAVQVANFDKIHGHPVATTMITGNLRSAMNNLQQYTLTGKKNARSGFFMYAVVIAAFGCGAFSGAMLCRRFFDKALLFCLVVIFASFLIIRTYEKKSQQKTVLT